MESDAWGDEGEDRDIDGETQRKGGLYIGRSGGELNYLSICWFIFTLVQDPK